MPSTEQSRSYSTVPLIPRLAPPPRMPAPPRPEGRQGLDPVPDALLALQHKMRRARAEARSLSPLYLRRVDAQHAAERTVEENLQQGRLEIRRQIRRATDPRRWFTFGQADFPRSRPLLMGLVWMMACGVLAMLAPFLAYFALVALIVM